jgi:hypothetical protein
MKKVLLILLCVSILIFGMILPSSAAMTDEQEMQRTENCIPIFACNVPIGGFELDTKDFKAGSSALSIKLGTYTNAEGEQVTVDGQAGFAFKFEHTIGVESIDATKMDTLEFWFYVSDKDALSQISFGDNAMELTSSGKYDSEETNWRLPAILEQCTQNGWNQIRLPLDNGANGETDWSRLNYLRWYFVRGNNLPATPLTIKIDHIRLTNYEAQQSIELKPIVEKLSADILEAVAGIPKWDEEDESIIAQYLEHGSEWAARLAPVTKRVEELSDVGERILADLGTKIDLNRANRWMERFAEYKEVNGIVDPPSEPDDSDEPDEPSEEEMPDMTVAYVIAVGIVLAIAADIFVYSMLKKKDRKNEA